MKIESYARDGGHDTASGKQAVEKLIRGQVERLCDEEFSRVDEEYTQMSVTNSDGWRITVYVHGQIDLHRIEGEYPRRYLFDLSPEELTRLLLDLAACDMEKVLKRRWSTKRDRPFYLYAKYPDTPDLFRAIASGDQEWVKAELAVGADVNHRDKHFGTPLHKAAIGGWTDICRLLLDAGADPTAVNDNGSTPANCARYADEYLHNKKAAAELVALLEAAAKRKV
jgi:hypothetical protein